MKTDKHTVNKQGGYNRLQNTDDGCLLTNLFKLGKSELVTDCERNEAKCKVAKDTEALNLLKRGKADTGDAKQTKAERTDNDTRNKVCGNGGKINKLRKTGKQKSRK